MKITAPLTALIMDQSHQYPNTTKAVQIRIKKESVKAKKQRQSQAAAELKDKLPTSLQRVISLSTEKGSSSWLSMLPIAEHGFALHKSAFCDAVCLRYGWYPSNKPLHCTCGKQFSVEPALSCPHGGFPSIRHNELCDITAELLSEVCRNVCTETPLQLTGKMVPDLDVAAEFWASDRQRAFFGIWVFNPFAPSYRNAPLAQGYRRNELEKKRAYDQRVREIEHGSFSPLVFSTTGGMGTTATVVYKQLASMI